MRLIFLIIFSFPILLKAQDSISAVRLYDDTTPTFQIESYLLEYKFLNDKRLGDHSAKIEIFKFYGRTFQSMGTIYGIYANPMNADDKPLMWIRKIFKKMYRS